MAQQHVEQKDQRHLRFGDVFGLYSSTHKGAVVGNRFFVPFLDFFLFLIP
jgi:hypothetical protein